MLLKLACGNVRKSLRDFAVYFITLALGVGVFYAFNSIDAQSTVLSLDTSQKSALETLGTLVRYVSMVVAVVLGFLVVYANRFLVKRRKREFGLYLVLGMGRAQVAAVLVLETLLVGALSLVAGILLGLAFSQLMMYLTALLFEVTFERFQFAFSETACLQTVALFGIVFGMSVVLDVFSVGRMRIVRLLQADRANEALRLRSFGLSLVLLVVSVAGIGYSYHLLREVGLLSVRDGSSGFITCTVLVFASTFLLFFSLSGVAQRVVQACPGVYLRGLNMFVFRQLNAKVNTAWASISAVSIVLFFAITSTCGGFALCSALNANLEQGASYDASYTVYWPDGDFEPDEEQAAQMKRARRAAEADGWSIAKAFERSMPGYGELVSKQAQVDFLLVDGSDYSLLLGGVDFGKTGVNSTVAESGRAMSEKRYPLYVVRESQYNELLELRGEQPVDIALGEYLVWCDVESIRPLYRAFLDGGGQLELADRALVPHGSGLVTTPYETTYQPQGSGALIVDDAFDALDGARIDHSILNLMFAGGRADGAAFDQMWGEAGSEDDGGVRPWPFETMGFAYYTAREAYEDAVTNTAVITYLAIYIGFVFLVACAAILALQQLTEASDNVHRYRLLRDLGTERRMVDGALFAQVLVYFVAPLLVAVCHSAVALGEVGKIVEMFGGLQILQPVLVTAAFALVVYGGYFLVTFLVSRSIVTARS